MEHDRARGQRPCIQPAVCVDDYGEAVFRGHYSGELVRASQAVYVGPVIPQAPLCYVDGPNGRAARAKSVRAFDENEANCNTCRHLIRLPGSKGVSGLLRGRCAGTADWSWHPYPADRGGVMRFAPDDWMGMACYEQRDERIR